MEQIPFNKVIPLLPHRFSEDPLAEEPERAESESDGVLNEQL